MQNKKKSDRFYSCNIAFWATLATLGVIFPAQAETSPARVNKAKPEAPQQVALTENTPTQANSTIQTSEISTNLDQETQSAVTSPAEPSGIAQDNNESATLGSQLIAQNTLDEGTSRASEPKPLPAAQDDLKGINIKPLLLAQDELDETETTAEEPRVLVAEIVINGAGPELEPEVARSLETTAGRPTTVSQLQDDVNRIYATGLFSNVTVTPEDTALGVRVTFNVQPNPVLRKVTIQALPEDESRDITPPELIDDIFGDRYGEIINLNDYQENSPPIRELEQWYQDNGYDLAKVVGVNEPTKNGRITLVVVEGVIEDVRVNFLNSDGEEVDGNTKPYIVTREVELKPGDVFKRETAQNDLERVFGLGLFEDVKLAFSPGEEDPTKAILNLNVIEGNTGSIALGGGVSSASGLFGTVSYQQQNVGGNNQRLSSELQLGTREFLFDVSFTDPWIGGDPYRTAYTVNAFRRRSISLIFDGGENDVDLAESGDRPRVLRTGGGINFSRPLSQDVFERSPWRASAGLQYEKVKITDSDGDIEFIDEAGNQLSFDDDGTDDLLSLKFGIVRDLRNNPLKPTSGSLTRFGSDQTIPIGSSGILFNRLRASHSIYVPVDFLNFSKEEGETLAFNVQGGTVIGDLPPYEAFSLGGSNSVRGYEEGDVGSGRSYLQATAEYRFPIFSVVGGALFVDYGTDLGTGDNVPGDPAGVRGKPGNGFGYGVGVRVQSPLGPIRVDYGLSDDGDSRIHFGIGERF